MSTINGRACVVNGKAVDKVFSDGRQVYGRNLLLDSKTQTKESAWYSTNDTLGPVQETYLGSKILYTKFSWISANYSYKDLLDRGVINTTNDFTYSIYFRVVGEDPAGMSYANIQFLSYATNLPDGSITMQITSLKEGQWTRIVVPFKFKDIKYDQTNDWGDSIRVFMTADTKVAGALYEFAAPKLEKGSVATPYSIAPEDVLK